MTNYSKEFRIMATLTKSKPKTRRPAPRRWTMAELRRMPAEKRDAILRRAAAKAATEYRNNPALTAFEAFDDKDLYVDSANSEPR